MSKSPSTLPAPAFDDPKHHLRIYQGDCLGLLAQIPESSVDLVFADPPYQAIRQEEGHLLSPPNLMTTGDGSRNTVIVGFSIASLPSIPFSATIEAETQIVASGNTTFQHRITKIARDSKGRTRIDTDLNAVGAPTDPRLVTVHIYDAVTKAEITLFPWHQSAIRIEYEAAWPF